MYPMPIISISNDHFYFSAINTLVDHHAGNLRSLTVDGAELTDVSFQAISKCCHLEELSVSFAELISDVGLQYIKVKLWCMKCTN